MPPSACSLLVLQAVLRENGERRFYTAYVNGFHWRWNGKSQPSQVEIKFLLAVLSLGALRPRGSEGNLWAPSGSPRQLTMAPLHHLQGDKLLFLS